MKINISARITALIFPHSQELRKRQKKKEKQQVKDTANDEIEDALGKWNSFEFFVGRVDYYEKNVRK